MSREISLIYSLFNKEDNKENSYKVSTYNSKQFMMKKINEKQMTAIAVSVVAIAIISFSYYSTNNTYKPNNNTISDNEYVIDKSDFVNGTNLINEIPIENLNENEINGLLLMREEEKLARDVYTFLEKKWGMKIFSNIASSEQTHTDAVKTLLDRYGLADPVKNDSIGAFTSDKISQLYKQLTEKGEKSLLDALIVGATIEDLDINDLNKLASETNNLDIINVYENLNRGSRNHMRAFTKQINRNGGNYIPQYITKSEFDSIIGSEQEKGMKQ